MQSNVTNMLAAIALSVGLAAPSLAAITFNEAVNGDASDDPTAPTNLGSLGFGLSTITGKFGRPPNAPLGGPADEPELDYISFTVPAGGQLDSFRVLSVDIGGAFSFLAIEAGPQVSVPWFTVDPSPLLGWYHYGSVDLNVDILPGMGVGQGAIGFSGPLGPGTYTLWLMELDQFRAYDWSFELRVVPAPSTAAVLLGAGVLASRRRR